MLKIFLNSTDVSNEAENFSVDTFSATLLATGELSIGYYKPINSVYVELSTFNTNTSVMSLYYYNGTSFITTSSLKDSTKGLKRSGFVKWDRDLTNEKSTTVNGVELFWYKIKLDADATAVTVKGINLVFSDDNDLKEEYPTIVDMLPDGEPTFINFHVASRKDILSYFKTQGKLVTQVGGKKKLLDQFDLLDIEEVRDASKFLTLAKIFYWISDATDDKWYQKATDFETEYNKKINLATLSVDSNDDGKAGINEVAKIQSIQVERR